MAHEEQGELQELILTILSQYKEEADQEEEEEEGSVDIDMLMDELGEHCNEETGEQLYEYEAVSMTLQMLEENGAIEDLGGESYMLVNRSHRQPSWSRPATGGRRSSGEGEEKRQQEQKQQNEHPFPQLKYLPARSIRVALMNVLHERQHSIPDSIPPSSLMDIEALHLLEPKMTEVAVGWSKKHLSHLKSTLLEYALRRSVTTEEEEGEEEEEKDSSLGDSAATLLAENMQELFPTPMERLELLDDLLQPLRLAIESKDGRRLSRRHEKLMFQALKSFTSTDKLEMTGELANLLLPSPLIAVRKVSLANNTKKEMAESNTSGTSGTSGGGETKSSRGAEEKQHDESSNESSNARNVVELRCDVTYPVWGEDGAASSSTNDGQKYMERFLSLSKTLLLIDRPSILRTLTDVGRMEYRTRKIILHDLVPGTKPLLTNSVLNRIRVLDVRNFMPTLNDSIFSFLTIFDTHFCFQYRLLSVQIF